MEPARSWWQIEGQLDSRARGNDEEAGGDSGQALFSEEFLIAYRPPKVNENVDVLVQRAFSGELRGKNWERPGR